MRLIPVGPDPLRDARSLGGILCIGEGVDKKSNEDPSRRISPSRCEMDSEERAVDDGDANEHYANDVSHQGWVLAMCDDHEHGNTDLSSYLGEESGCMSME